MISNSNHDGSRCGEAFNGAAFAGLSSPAYGTLTAGRQDGLDFSLMAAYDPMDLAPAFSLIASGGTGDTETARWDNSVKYVFQYGPIHAAAMYSLGGQDTALVNGGHAFNLGGAYRGLPADANFTRDKGAISSVYFNGTDGLPCPGAGCAANTLSGTITDDTAWTFGAKYTFELGAGFKDETPSSLTLFGGYQYSDRANPAPTDQAPPGTTTIGGYVLAQINNQPYLPGSDRIQQTEWTAGPTRLVPGPSPRPITI